MNRTGIALAADSAVTLHKGKKIFNSVNKLFMLSKYEPVGIMVYGNAELHDYPWETLIKQYRAELRNRSFDTIDEYGSDFCNWIGNVVKSIPGELQDQHLLGYAYEPFAEITEHVRFWVRNAVKNHELTDERYAAIVSAVIQQAHQRWEAYSILPNLSHRVDDVRTRIEAGIGEFIAHFFDPDELGTEQLESLKEIAVCAVVKDRFFSTSSGIVIAGFGAKEMFPTLVNYLVDGSVFGVLKHKMKVNRKVGFDCSASVIPFAQGDVVANFLEGVDPDYDYQVHSGIRNLLTNQYPATIARVLESEISDFQMENVEDFLQEVGKGLTKDFVNWLEEYKKEKHIDPLLDAIEALPKDELAATAEALVNLTSFKRRVSMDAETVGGPIDVAVISKGDGFVWIKRKHYFQAEENVHFSKKYYYDVRGDLSESADEIG